MANTRSDYGMEPRLWRPRCEVVQRQSAVFNNPAVAVNFAKEPIVLATAKPGQLACSSVGTGSTPHSVESDPPNPGDPAFASSATLTGNGNVHTVVFASVGEYEYDCAVHGSAAMSGKIVVQ